MKILVLSDSHASRAFMRLCVEKIKPRHVIHLGDHYEDAQVLAEENPEICMHCVPGNCDAFRCEPNVPGILCYPIGGVKVFMTHGHLHGVKNGLHHLLADARSRGAQAVLFGHTHEPLCFWESDGLLVLNPGSCRGYGGSAAVIGIVDEKISACTIIRQAELDTL